MNFGFSHLVVNGCSFTYCTGLDNPLNEGWPKLLADKLGIPVINLAVPGSGNDTIFRNTVEHLYSDPLPNPLYVIAFSHSSRREEYNLQTKQYAQVHLVSSSFSKLTYFEKGYALNYDPIEREKNKIRVWLALQNTFKANNIKYLTTDFIPDPSIEQTLKQSYSPLWDAVNNDENRITDLEQLTRNIRKLPCGHEDYSAMPVLANYIYEEIRKRWH